MRAISWHCAAFTLIVGDRTMHESEVMADGRCVVEHRCLYRRPRLLVAVHEFGHFWVARRCGVKVERFSIGFGKAIWRRLGKDGTEYVLALIPSRLRQDAGWPGGRAQAR